MIHDAVKYVAVALGVASLGGLVAVAAEPHQYAAEGIQIPAASADEPLRAEVSTELASRYLEQGSTAWNSQRKCVSCHTNGAYMTVRPALSATLGPPPETTRRFFLETLAGLRTAERPTLQKSTRPAQAIYVAAGLAEWDDRIVGTLSNETEQAIELMLELQLESGTWNTLDCWPPYESDAFHEATVAATAVATAPGWLERVKQHEQAKQRASVERLRHYLQTTPPPHDYGATLLLGTAARWPGLISDERKAELVRMIRNHQREDGGWSIRTFAAPEAWGRGNRADKLREEPDFGHPASDGHMTGLAIVTLRESGVPADDPAIRKGVAWLKANQRASGRWWTRSLNTDSWHFITYSGTALPLLALQMCDELPRP